MCFFAKNVLNVLIVFLFIILLLVLLSNITTGLLLLLITVVEFFISDMFIRNNLNKSLDLFRLLSQKQRFLTKLVNISINYLTNNISLNYCNSLF